MLVDKDSILNEISKMTVMELVDFIDAAEKKFKISVANIMQSTQQVTTPTSDGVDEMLEQRTEFKVSLDNYGADKIQVIKIIRNITKLGLKESKELVESAPVLLKDNISKIEAEAIKKELETAGAVVSIK